MSNFTKCMSSGAHNIVFSLLCKLVGTIPQVWEQSRPFLRCRVNLLWEQTQEGGNFLRACELADTTVPLYYECRMNLLWEQTQEGGNFLRACELVDTTVPLYYDDDDMI